MAKRRAGERDVGAAVESGIEMETNWYLVRTKAGEERIAQGHLAQLAGDLLLPLLKVRVRRWGRMVDSVAPLFPSYLFAQLDYERECGRVRFTRGVRDIVCFGHQPADVPRWIVEEMKQRCAQGPVELPRHAFSPGEPVRVIDGPLEGFEGIFQHHLSGAERVAVLLSTMSGARAVLPAKMIVPVA
jgi:transcriptional antiterminator RfaH